MRYCLVDTAIGTFGLAWSDKGVARVALPGPDAARTESRIGRDGAVPATPDGDLADLPGMVRRYAQGGRVDFSAIPLDLEGVNAFNRDCYAELLKLGYGETTTYGAIARTLGDIALSRSVGQAMGQNPVPLLVPCHRVLGADGKAGGFTAPGGVGAKMQMLALERATSPSGQYAFGF